MDVLKDPEPLRSGSHEEGNPAHRQRAGYF